MALKPKVDRVPIGAYGPGYRSGSAKAAHARRIGPTKTPEQMAADLATSQENFANLMRETALSWGVRPEDVELFATDQVAYGELMERRKAEKSGGQKSLDKNNDREARKAVEGDTDLNHDNLEGGE